MLFAMRDSDMLVFTAVPAFSRWFPISKQLDLGSCETKTTNLSFSVRLGLQDKPGCGIIRLTINIPKKGP